MDDSNSLDLLRDDLFDEILKIIHSLTGITIAKHRKNMVIGRLRKRVRALRLNGYDEYLPLIKNDEGERKTLIDLITTNETYFFRTPRVWEFIEKKFLPEWFNNNPSQTFTAWSAAASSGEEAHSLGITCQIFKENHPGFNFQILGTDISQEMVKLCKEGLYQGKSINTFKLQKPDAFNKYMTLTDEEMYRVIPEIKSRLKFQEHNLFNRLATDENFNLVLLRNVLIYFIKEDQEKVLSNVYKKMKPKGVLIIGESESLSHVTTDFSHIEPLFYSKEV